MSAEDKQAKAAAKAQAKELKARLAAEKKGVDAARKAVNGAVTEALKGKRSVGRKGFICAFSGAEIGTRTQIQLLPMSGKDTSTAVGSFESLPAAFQFLMATIPRAAFEEIRAYNEHVYKQSNVPLNVEKLSDDARSFWTSIPGTETFEDYTASRAQAKAQRAAKKAQADPDAVLKTVTKKAAKAAAAKPAELLIPAGSSVIVKPSKNVAKALVTLASFEEQTRVRHALSKKPGCGYEVRGGAYIDRVTVGGEKGKANPWVPGAYGSAIVTTGKKPLKLVAAIEVAE